MLTDVDPKNEDWQINIRSDLWPNMSTHELNTQLELVITKISVLARLPSTDPTVQSIGLALQRALDYLTQLINQKTEPTKRTKM